MAVATDARTSTTRLTARQRAVLVAVASGHTNREIADQLGITEDGVNAHLSRMYLRYGVGNRVELLAAVGSALLAEVGSDGAALRAIRATVIGAHAQVTALEARPTSGVASERLVAVRDQIHAVNSALGMVTELPPEATGPMIEAVRRRLSEALVRLDEVAAVS